MSTFKVQLRDNSFMTKNGLRIKKEKKEAFLRACLKNGLKVQKSNVTEPNHLTYIIFFNHIQQVFKAGYYFSEFI